MDTYYLWSIFISELSVTPNNSAIFFDLYQKIRAKEEIEINLFILVLDWLFLLQIITYKDSKITLQCL